MPSPSLPNSGTPTPIPDSRLPRNVWTLGWVAFFNDTATEMSYWLLPQFLTSVLGAGPMAFGFIEGAAETVASFTRLLSGVLSDRWRRRKPIAAAGYTVANLAKPLLAVAQSWPQVFWIRFADRGSKGLRAVPRDALIADSVHSSQRGAAFGLLQAMDTAGAILGPLSATLLVLVFHGNVRDVFWVAAIPGAITVALAWAAVREVRPAKTENRNSTIDTGKSKSENRNWKIEARLKWMLLAVAVFSLGNSSDLFLILRSQNLGLRPALAPVLGLTFNVVYTALSWPAGKLSDRIPRRAFIVGGYAIYALVYFGFARATSPLAAWVLFPAYGLYYALTEGVLKAWIADLAPGPRRASMYGLFNWVVGLAAFPASVLAGWLWRHYNPAAPFYVSAALALLAALLLLQA